MSVDLLFILSKTFDEIYVFDKELKSCLLNLPMFPLNIPPITLVAEFSLDFYVPITLPIPADFASTFVIFLAKTLEAGRTSFSSPGEGESTFYSLLQQKVYEFMSVPQRLPIYFVNG